MTSTRLLCAILLAALAAGCASASPPSRRDPPRALCVDEPRPGAGSSLMTGPMARFFLFCFQSQ